MSVREWYTFDTETEVIHPGNVTPRVVCLQSMRSRVHRKKIISDAPSIHTVADFPKTNLVGNPARQVAIELQHGKGIFVGHNIPYDWGVLCAEMPRSEEHTSELQSH